MGVEYFYMEKGGDILLLFSCIKMLLVYISITRDFTLSLQVD